MESSAEAQRVRAELRAVVTPEFQSGLRDIFLGIALRSGISFGHTNVEALDQDPLFVAHGDTDASYSSAFNRVIYRAEAVSDSDHQRFVDAAQNLYQRLGLTDNTEAQASLDVIQRLVENIHEKTHLMGRVYIDATEAPQGKWRSFLEQFAIWKLFKRNVLEEVGFHKVYWNEAERKREHLGMGASEGFTDLFSHLMLDELNRRLGLGLDLKLYFGQFVGAHEASQISYSSFEFVMMRTIQTIAQHTSQPLSVVFDAFTRAYFAGDDLYQKQCRLLIQEACGDSYYTEFAALKTAADEKGNIVCDTHTKGFIERWSLGDVEQDFGTLMEDFRASRPFAQITWNPDLEAAARDGETNI